MKIIKICLIFQLVTFSIYSQKTVAVYVTGGNDKGINQVLGDKLVESFVKSGRYTAIERTSSFLDELSKEQLNSTCDNELRIIGKKIGAQLVCVAEVSEVLGEKYVSARLIDVETTVIVSTSNSGTLQMKNINDLHIISEKIAFDLSGKTGKEQYVQAAKEQKQQETLNAINSLVEGVSTLLEGTIIISNKDKDPFNIYINNKYMGVIQGYTTIQKNVAPGNYSVKVVEKSGYILSQQIQLFNVYVESRKSVLCKWD